MASDFEHQVTTRMDAFEAQLNAVQDMMSAKLSELQTQMDHCLERKADDPLVPEAETILANTGAPDLQWVSPNTTTEQDEPTRWAESDTCVRPHPPYAPSTTVPKSAPIARDTTSTSTQLASEDEDLRFHVGLNIIHPTHGTGTIVQVLCACLQTTTYSVWPIYELWPIGPTTYCLRPTAFNRWRIAHGVWPMSVVVNHVARPQRRRVLHGRVRQRRAPLVQQKVDAGPIKHSIERSIERPIEAWRLQKLKDDENTIPLAHDSIWDAALVIGQPELGPFVSVYSALVLVLNALTQVL